MFGWRPVRATGGPAAAGYAQLVDLKDGNWSGNPLFNVRPATTEEKCARALEELQQGDVRIGFAIPRADDGQAIERVRAMIAQAGPAMTERLFVEFDAGHALMENTAFLGSLMGMLQAGVSLVASHVEGIRQSAKSLAMLEVAAVKVAPFTRRYGEPATPSHDALVEMHRQARAIAPAVIATHIDHPAQLERARDAGFQFVQGDAVAAVSISRPWRILGTAQSTLQPHIH